MDKACKQFVFIFCIPTGTLLNRFPLAHLINDSYTYKQLGNMLSWGGDREMRTLHYWWEYKLIPYIWKLIKQYLSKLQMFMTFVQHVCLLLQI